MGLKIDDEENFRIQDDFHKKRGEALGMALAVENYLEFFISNYFIKPQNQKTFFFDRTMVQPLSFLQKINLFYDICKRERFDDQKVKDLIKTLNSIREIRNKIAHWETMANPQKKEISLMKRGEIINPENYLVLDDKMMKDLDEKRLKAITQIVEFHMKHNKEGTVDEKWEQKGIRDLKNNI